MSTPDRDAELERRLRELHDGFHGTQGCGIEDDDIGCYLPSALRTAARIGAELAYEDAAKYVDNSLNYRTGYIGIYGVADEFRARAGTGGGK